MKQIKKLTALLMAICMLVGILPMNLLNVNATGTGDTTYVLAGGDFQEAGDHANSAANVTNILAQISQKYTTMDGFLFIGDYDCETHDDATETANGISTLMDTVDNVYTNINHSNSILAQGNHDYKDTNIDATGGHDFDGYSAYVLNEDDYPNGGGSSSGIQTLANNMKTWLNNKIGEGYSAPIFIVSHLPLAFTPRTVTQGDAKYAKYIFDVLNDAGENGLNIIFLHGHDHAYGPDNYMGGEAIYLAEGDKINIAEAGSTSAWTEETLNFTYMNAGYTGYYSDPYTYVTTAGTDKLTMTVFAITDNQVTVERYSANGLYNMKSAGYDGSYSDTSVTATSLGLTINNTVYASPQTIALTEAETYGTIGEWVAVEAETPIDDVTTSGNSWVQITAPIPGTEAVPGTTSYQYTLDTDGVNENSPYLIVGSSNAKAMGNGSLTAVDTTISGSTATMSSRDYEWTITSDGKITNGTYWLKFTQSGSFLNRSGSVSLETSESNATTWTVTHNGDGSYMVSAEASYSFIGTRYVDFYLRYNNNAFSVTNSENTVRLYGNVQTITTPGTEATPDTNGLYGKLVGDLTYNVAVGTSAEEALATVKAGIDAYYVEAMSTPGTSVTTNVADDSIITWTLDPNYNGNTPGDYAVTISYGGVTLGIAEVVVPAATTYYIAEGNGLYLVDMNTSADDAMAAVKAGITVSSATDTNGTNKTTIDDSLVTWNWVDTYNGADSGPYTVEILYDGTSLGTVEVKVNIKYETGLNEGWTSVGTTTGGYKYVLDTDGIEYGENNKYIIVAADQDIVLNANSSSDGTAHSITIDGTTAILDTRDYEYHMIQTTYNGTRYELITKGDGSQYLYQESSGVRYGTRSSVKFQVNHHGNGVYDIHDIDGTNWYIIYDGSWTVTETTSARVRLYKYDGEIVGGEQYAQIQGDTVYTVDQGTSATQALAAVKAGITGYISSNADGSGATELADSELTWKWKNTYTSMYTGSYWVEISYNGVVLGTVEVQVKPAVINNYPEYPDEGAVKVNKTATGIDFQSTGIAQVELSASGVPSKKGVDVILMLDTSSSMGYCLDCTNTKHDSYECDQGGQTRAQALEETLETFVAQAKTPGDDGQLLDIDVAIADFNGFYGDDHSESGTPYDRDAADMMSDEISYTADSAAQIYTGDKTLGAGAFVNAEDLATSFNLTYDSGTNYDYAFDAIYQMATAKKIANGGEDRDLYVIFMSDGAAMQWNYYHSQGPSELWNNWITGAWDADDLTTTNLNCTTHAYYYDEVDHDGDGYINEHRMANAIKGDPSETFEVIRKTNDLGVATGEENMYRVQGLGAQLFSIAFDPRVDNNVTVASMTKSIASLASDQTGTTQYFYNVDSADELTDAFNVIGTEIAYAASNARFVDQMGDNFNLQLETKTYTAADGEKTLAPVIEILSYDIYTKAEADAVAEGTEGDTVTNAMIGDRKGTSTLQEVVKFSDDGTKAYSNLIDVDGDGIYGVTLGTDGTYTISDTDDNIIGTDGVIYAKTFAYNTTQTSVYLDVDLNSANGNEYELKKETFYWKMGTITTSELAMRYYVYLDGSMEGTKEAGSYATNNFAVLYYDNYLGNECKKETVSPVLAWKSANVRYAFYLVDENGNIVVNQTTGETGSFANKVAVTNPVVYKEILLNNTEQTHALDVASLGVLPEGYTLYDSDAAYTVTINSDSTGKWVVTKGTDKATTTYITGFNGAAYSNELQTESNAYDYTHTTVWFAVQYMIQTVPDTVVIDYGLPVDISVLVNDMFGDYGKLVGIGSQTSIPTTEQADGTTARVQFSTTLDTEKFGSTYTAEFGTALLQKDASGVSTGKVRYTPNTIAMNTKETFAYVVNYTGTSNSGYYYGDVTVIPATTVYYEDNFITFEGKTRQDAESDYVANNAVWQEVGTYGNATQAEDRPGFYSLSESDKNNLYGYDQAYDNANMATYSMGSAMMAHIEPGTIGTATFDFWGTGFDVVGLTSSKTGVLIVQIYDYDSDELLKSYIVDTYYGYTYVDGEWVVNTANTTGTTDNALYQIPVMKIEELTNEYGHYKVKITASHSETFDHTAEAGYDLYLDAIRIYNPTGNLDDSITEVYELDKEGWPTYYELRNQIITANSFGSATVDTEVISGAVMIDGKGVNATVSDYSNYGPNNEVYLKAGQSVVFNLNLQNADYIADVQLGVKSANGIAANCVIYNAGSDGAYNKILKSLTSSTDMYYSIYDQRNGTIVITNDSESNGIISLTNIKITYTENPNGTSETSLFYVTPRTVGFALRASSYVPPVSETPEAEIPEQEVVTGDVTVDNNSTIDTNSDNVAIEDKAENAVVENTDGANVVQDESVADSVKKTDEEVETEVAIKELSFFDKIWNLLKMLVSFVEDLFSNLW